MRLMMVAVVCLLAAGGASAWMSPSNLTAAFNPDNGDYFPDVVCDSTGNVHLVWCSALDPENWRIYHRMRSPSGQWTSPALISGSHARWVRCAIDPLNNLHVAWHGGSTQAGSEIYYRMRAASGTWGPIVNISNSASASLYPDIACDLLGRVFVVWHENLQDGDKDWDVAMQRFDGSGWLPQFERLTTDSDFDVYPVIACDAANVLHLVYTSYEEIFYRSRLPTGAWTATVNLSRNSGRSRDPALAVTPQGMAHVVWHDDSPGNWEVFYATGSGGSWSGPLNISNNPGEVDAYASVCVGPDGSVNVSWMDYSRLYFTRDRGNGFSGSAVLYTGQASSSSLCAEPGGTVQLVWQDRSPGNWDILLTSHVYPDRIPPAQAQFSATGSDGRIYLKWTNPADLDFRSTVIRYATDGFPATPSDGALLLERLGNRGYPDSHVHDGLPNGLSLYYSLFTLDFEGNWSYPAQCAASTLDLAVGHVRGFPDNTTADLRNKVVTAVFPADGVIYVGEADRSAGIRVLYSGSSLVAGDRVSVAGTVATRTLSGYPAERQITNAVISRVAAGSPVRPVGVNSNAIGGEGRPPYVPGIIGGSGLNNVGLLASYTGRVAAKIGASLWVDDGSGLTDPSGRPGVMVKCPTATIPCSVGDVVTVIGIIEGSIQSGTTENRRLLHIASYDSLQVQAP